MSTQILSRTDPDHSIIDQPWTYQLTEFNYHNNLDNWWQSYIDMTLQRGGIMRRLRFTAPRSLQIEQGFPMSTGRMVIRDVRRRGIAGVGVYVGDDESTWGAVTFWARDVIDLDLIDRQQE